MKRNYLLDLIKHIEFILLYITARANHLSTYNTGVAQISAESVDRANLIGIGVKIWEYILLYIIYYICYIDCIIYNHIY